MSVRSFRLNGTLVRFVIAGVLTNIVYAVVLLLVRSLGADWWLAGTAAYLISLVANYGLQRHFTFRSVDSNTVNGWKYLVAQGLCLAINALVVDLVAGRLGLHPLIAQGCSVLATLAISYLLMSRWVFAEAPSAASPSRREG